MLIEDLCAEGDDHIALEVADAAGLERAMREAERAGAKLLGGVYDGEPGIDRAGRLLAPGGHVFKLFCGMQTGAKLASGDRPEKFEHVSVEVEAHGTLRALPAGGARVPVQRPNGATGELVAL